MTTKNQLERDKYGLYIHGNNYRAYRNIYEKAELRQARWDAIPKWKRLFIDKFKWFTAH